VWDDGQAVICSRMGAGHIDVVAGRAWGSGRNVIYQIVIGDGDAAICDLMRPQRSARRTTAGEVQ
jgi:hypothetical protein